jgi:uncharacterized damage-inducible protein DinB
MPISEILLAEFDHEMANTRRTLERVPDGKFDWKPHDKSFSFKQLAGHLANIPNWAAVTCKEDSFDVSPGGKHVETPEPNTTAELLSMFDENVRTAREVLAATTDEQFAQPWSLLVNKETLFTMPRSAVLRGMIFNHAIHHRGQLTVYLRLNDLPVPALYGPSADEQGS